MELKLDSYVCLHGKQEYSFTFYREKVLTEPITIPNLTEVLDNTESSPYVNNDFQKLLK